jgi:hypothetical protein
MRSLLARASRPGAAPSGQQRRACIDVDAIQVGYAQLQLASGPAAGAFCIGPGIGIAGMDINCVCDGACRTIPNVHLVNEQLRSENETVFIHFGGDHVSTAH